MFGAGLIQLFCGLLAGFEGYTYLYENLHDSIFEEPEPAPEKPYTRFTAVCFLVIGTGASLGVGLLIGNFLENFLTPTMPLIFSASLKPEFVFYPPIVVLFVDLMHAFAARFDH